MSDQQVCTLQYLVCEYYIKPNSLHSACSATPGRRARGSSKQSDASFVPKLLPKPAQNPCDAQVLFLGLLIEYTEFNLNL